MRFIPKPRMPSPAMTVALVALFVALSGSAYALQTIRDRSLTGRKFQENSIGGTAVKESALSKRSMAGTLFKVDSIGGNAVKESTLGSVPMADGVNRFAVVNSLGQLVRGRGVAANGVARTDAGRYTITFDREVATCAYFATLADPATANPPTGQVGASTFAGNPNAVQLRTTNATGVAADRPFHLIVNC